jgi:multidrug efflux pump subunit AcrA (membrane-fusion protein)
LVLGGSAVALWLRPASVDAKRVVRGQAVRAVYATGNVEAFDRVEVRAKVSGSVEELRVREGDPVDKGAPLAQIDNPSLTYELERGNVDLRAAVAQAVEGSPALSAMRSKQSVIEAELSNARRELERARQLEGRGAVGSAEVDRAGARVAALESSLLAARSDEQSAGIDLEANRHRQAAQVKSLRARVKDTVVTSPLGGVVLRRYVEPGEVVSQNQPLLLVGDISRLVLEVSVDEADVTRLCVQGEACPLTRAAVRLFAFPGETFDGTLIELMPDADRDKKSFLAKVELSRPPPRLRSGMTAEVNFIVDRQPDALLVERGALDGNALWVVSDHRVARRQVTLGIQDLLRVQILSGVQAGDLVVVDGHGRLREGQRVAPT